MKKSETSRKRGAGSRSRYGPDLISFMERGLRQPTLKTLFALASALDTTPSALVASVEARMSGRK